MNIEIHVAFIRNIYDIFIIGFVNCLRTDYLLPDKQVKFHRPVAGSDGRFSPEFHTCKVVGYFGKPRLPRCMYKITVRNGHHTSRQRCLKLI